MEDIKDNEMEYRIIIPEIPPSLNVIFNWHWAVRNKEKIRWAAMIYYEINNLKRRNQLPNKIYGKVSIKIIYYFKTKANHDYDNYSGKFIMDGLKNIIIEDDNQNIVTELTHRFEYSKENPRTEIVIKEGG